MDELIIDEIGYAIDEILRIDTKSFNTPAKLAKAYLRFRQDQQALIQLKDQMNSGAQFELYLKMLEKYNDFLAIFDNLKDEIYPPGVRVRVNHSLENERKKMLKKLSSLTAKDLHDNYSDAATTSVMDAIIDFQVFVDLSAEVNDLLWRLTDARKEIPKDARSVIKATEVILKKGALTEEERRLIEGINKRKESILENLPEELIDPVCVVLLCRRALRDMPYESEDLYEDYMSILASTAFPRPQGRHKDIFFKALQVIIYELLTKNGPKNRKRYIEWSKDLTARIINECYAGKGLWKLSKKDVDNSLLHIKSS